MDAKEEIEHLRTWIDNEKESLELFENRIKSLQVCAEMCRANLKKYEELLAAELSQVSA